MTITLDTAAPDRDHSGPVTCKDVAESLMDYLDGMLSPAQRMRVEEHFAECASCVRTREHYKRTVELGRMALAISELPMPAGALDALKRRRP